MLTNKRQWGNGLSFDTALHIALHCCIARLQPSITHVQTVIAASGAPDVPIVHRPSFTHLASQLTK
jgi:hypothetical protein